ncbi:cell division protein FtsA [Oceanobacillus manasiensis]|uniref:cell division protein FtsA n=1 Tax=Oceanobacillus manasiensis TaxID=586413 RepID=UPI0005A73424|nr:cell division FtsA domain-containing protein [Oceanobacillus manasiensis]
MDDRIFALDIGTRSVTGIILEKEDTNYKVVDFYTKEHTERSMRDGQIHNVVAVSDIIREVKKKLEQTHGTLQKVCVAAAGRALKTTQATATIELNQQPIMEEETIKHLELSAVQAAQVKLAHGSKSEEYHHYYCVGYSILHYQIDEEKIGSLIDQSGEKAMVEIIATFLPKIVVESLLAALGRAELEMEALTLEPIAAIHVLVPESMRRLNVALVDIGAGTSDIAITNAGTVAAYGMVPVAGDEITEAISDAYLLDFPLAEQTKRDIVNKGEAIVADILGFETTITYDSLVEEIRSKVENLASKISEEILLLNATPPKAVMLVGGGSLTPEITKLLAHKLKLPENRVAVRGIDAIQNLVPSEALPKGPDFVTPIGIAIAAKQNPVHYVTVNVNKQKVRMFEMKQLTVGDTLIQAGLDIHKMYGRPGTAMMVTVNGKEITIPGQLGQTPQLFVNQKKATVDHMIQNNECVQIERGKDGLPAQMTLEELIGELPTKVIYFNKQPIKCYANYYVNGRKQAKTYQIKDRDIITYEHETTVKDLIRITGKEKVQQTNAFSVYVNNEKVTLPMGKTRIFVNHNQTDDTQLLHNNDKLNIEPATTPLVSDLFSVLGKELSKTIHVHFNGQFIKMERPCYSIKRNGEQIGPDTELQDQNHIKMEPKIEEAFIFQDIFRYIDIDISKVSGDFKLYVNERPASFDGEIKDGDQLQITW